MIKHRFTLVPLAHTENAKQKNSAIASRKTVKYFLGTLLRILDKNAAEATCLARYSMWKQELPTDVASPSDGNSNPIEKNMSTSKCAEFSRYLLFDEGKELYVKLADDWYSRLCGLIGQPPLRKSEALILKPCSAVHSFGLQYTIDVVFVDRCGIILRCAQLKPGSMMTSWRAHAVIEMAEGTINRLGLRKGQQFSIARR